MSNNRLLIYLLNLVLSRFSGLKAVTKTAIIYPMASKIRTEYDSEMDLDEIQNKIDTIKKRYQSLGYSLARIKSPDRISENGIVILDISEGICLLYTSPSPRDRTRSRMPSSA